ncbi:hypothetical protein ABH926_003406 [Catenulispora sp. GP43]|uniref:hypothetical protein n=1 Tax=Catenulispora sp. GP43 TaxID=3156263 RepID=UPI0035196DFC
MTYADVDVAEPREEARLAAARRVADAILFEGYILYPYRATSAKNQMRWQFGMLGPDGAARAGVGEESGMRATLLVQPETDADVGVDLNLRFLHPQFRSVERTTGAGFEPAESLTIAGTHWIPWHEAVVCEVPLTGITSDTVIPIEIAGCQETEPLHDDGRLAGRLVRTRERLRGRVSVSWRRLDAVAGRPLLAVDVEVTNLGRWDRSGAADTARTAARDLAARTSFAGAHVVARAEGGRFLSLTDPPSWASQAAATGDQHRCWPVLLGDEGGPDDLVLVSPIILSDRPAVAPESAGDFFDATEIDEMLALRVRTLTDDEKAQARGTDPRAAEIVDRCDTMTDAVLAGLHGVVRDSAGGSWADKISADKISAHKIFDQPDTPDIFATSDTPWWDPEADASVAPETDTVVVAGVAVGKGSKVRLHPLRRADAQDMFLAGQSATVAAVLHDVDDGVHVAVTLDDDPANDLHAWYGRYHYFAPEELEPLR